MKIAIISCYKDPDYVRARVLRAGLAADSRVELITIKNQWTTFLRYPEVLCKVLWVKISQRPDVFIVTFRGYEILPFVQLFAGRKPVVFDEFINLVEYVVYEHHKLKPRSEPARLLALWYSWLLRRNELILADTPAHAAYSAALSGVSHSLYRAIPVGSDEENFKFNQTGDSGSKKFEILFCGNMKALYGLSYVLEAAEALKDQKDIHFTIIGGKQHAAEATAVAAANGANIIYKAWIPYKDLPAAYRKASLCLAGPYGDTEQSRLIITGKTYQMLACGAPTLVGRSHASSVFTDKVDCLLVPQGDSVALASKIQWAYDNLKKLDKIGKNGRKLYDKKFSSVVIAKKLSALVSELANA